MPELVAYSPSDLAEDDKQEQRRTEWQEIQDRAEPVVRRLSELAKQQAALRKPVEKRWLQDLRQYWGQYDPDVQGALDNDNERSRLFINITRTKTNAWSARLGDMLFPNDEKNWGIDPTPVPEMTREAREATAMAEEMEAKAEEGVDEHNAMVDAGQVPEGQSTQAIATAQESAGKAKLIRQAADAFQRKIEEARKRCSAMERQIDDALTESRFPATCRDAIDDMCRIGIGVVKGPVVASRPMSRWIVDDETGDAKLEEGDSTNPTYRRVNYWHFFPDMSAADISEAEFTFERHLPNRKALRKMARDMGFIPETVRRLLDPKRSELGQASTDDDLNYLQELRSIEIQSGEADTTLGPLTDRYVVWEYRGTLECEDIAKMLRLAGRSEEADRFEKDADPLKDHLATVFFCEGMLLKIEEDYLLDSGESLYSVAPFEKTEASILGSVGVPRLMRDEQAMINSAVRMVMDNGALAAAPQVVIDQQAIEPVDGTWKLTSRKLWRRIKSSVGTNPENKPFETFDIPLNQAQLAQIVEMAMRFIDEAVAMPIIAQGEQGAHVTQTAQGMTMLFNSANVVFRRVVKNYDDDMIGLIRRSYDFFMQFSNRPEIKGDMKVEARGTSVLLVREVQSQVLMQIIREWSTHPILGVGFRAYHAMRMVLQAMSINPDDLLVSEEDFLAKLKQMAEGSGEETPDAIRAKASVETATIDAESRREQGQVTLQVADIHRQTEFAKLAQNREISLTQIEAMFRTKEVDAHVKLGTKRMETDSKERSLAAEIAIERENKREAEARGLEPTGSGGAVSMGAKAE